MGTSISKLGEAERDIIIAKLTRLRHLAIVKLALLLRLNIDELLGLKYEDITWVNGKSKTMLLRRRVLYYGIDGKFDFYISDDTSNRQITLPRKANEIIKWLERNEVASRTKYARVYSDEFNGFICTNKCGRLYEPIALKRYFKSLFSRTIRRQSTH